MIRPMFVILVTSVGLFACEGNISLDWGKKTEVAKTTASTSVPASAASSQPSGFFDKASGWWENNKPVGGVGVSFAVKPTPPPPVPWYEKLLDKLFLFGLLSAALVGLFFLIRSGFRSSSRRGGGGGGGFDLDFDD